MALEKNYAILEIQKTLLDVNVDASKFPSDADLYLEVAKETYDQLEQIFRLVFEPTFNEDFLGERVKEVEEQKTLFENEGLKEQIEQAEEEKEVLQQNFKRVSDELNKLVMVNEALHVNFKEHLDSKQDEVNWLRGLVAAGLGLQRKAGM